MPRDDDFWFRLGYAAERALGRVSPGEKKPRQPRRKEAREPAVGEAAGRLIAAGAGTSVVRLLERWGGRGRPGPLSLIRAAGAGAAAALLVEVARPLLTRQELSLDGDLIRELLSGAGAGLVYAALVEPRVPGPPLFRGAVYGTVEYLISPWGGLGDVLGPLTPQKRLPLVGALLEDGDHPRTSWVEQLAFAVALAELYGHGGGD